MIAWIIAAFSSPTGVVVLAALDSTLFFTLPFGIDGAVIACAARAHGAFAIAVPLLATAGSTAGSAFTYWMGAKIGEKGLETHVPQKRLARVRRTLKTSGPLTLAGLDMLPPPFPMTPFVLAAGALKVNLPATVTGLALSRLIRFAVETYFAKRFGQHIITWMESPVVSHVVVACIVFAVAFSVFSIVRIVMSYRLQPDQRRAA